MLGEGDGLGSVSNQAAGRRAHQAGDLLTVLIVETAAASQQANTQAEKKHDHKVAPSTGMLKLVPQAGFSDGHKFSGQGATSRSSNLTARMTVQVVRVQPDGMLEIEGTRSVMINDEKQELRLVRPDFSTAARMVDAINRKLGGGAASPVDPGAVRVRIPRERAENLVALIAELEAISVEPDLPARVVVNERTGTVVIGGRAAIAPVAVSHGSLVVEIAQEPVVSQPAP